MTKSSSSEKCCKRGKRGHRGFRGPNGISIVGPTGATGPAGPGDTSCDVLHTNITPCEGDTIFLHGEVGVDPSVSNPNNVAVVKAVGPNVSLALTPSGTGALLADEPDGTVVGGDPRGSKAVDLQMGRSTSTQVASGEFSVIGGGTSNIASGNTSTLSGGVANNSSGLGSTVSGGQLNNAAGISSTVGGGAQNFASGNSSTVGGGTQNLASGNTSTVSGGASNVSSGENSTVAGGFLNVASNTGSTVGGGVGNTSSNTSSTVGGGTSNISSGENSTVGGGLENVASGDFSTIAGGDQNVASGPNSTIGGGSGNSSGVYSTVPGGRNNTAVDVGFAAGSNANAANPRCFVWNSGLTATTDDDNQVIFNLRPLDNYIPGTGPETFNINGDVFVVGNLAASGSKPFVQSHPVLEGKKLRHFAIEDPYCDLIYRGQVRLANGTAVVNIDESTGMTAGTFAALTNSPLVYLTNDTNFDLVKVHDTSQVYTGIFTIVSNSIGSFAAVNWLVIAKRNGINDPIEF